MTDRNGAGHEDSADDTSGKNGESTKRSTEETAKAAKSTDPQRAPHDRTALPPWFPVAFVGLGVLVLAATIRTLGGMDHGIGDGPLSGARALVVIPMVVLLVWVATAFGKRRDPGYGVVNRAGTATLTLIGTITVVAALGLILDGRAAPTPLLENGPTQSAPSLSPSTVTASPSQTPRPPHGDNSAALPLGLLFGAIAVLVLVIGLLALVRAVRRPRLPFGPHSAALDTLDEAEELAEAAEAGSQALEYRGEAREAVIACYAAMEHAVQAFGFARPLADTPEDLLRRATERGLVPPGPGAQLTDLFREARFSRHPITEAQRETARAALAEIGAHARALQAENAAKAAAAAEERAAQSASSSAAAASGARGRGSR